MVSSVYSAPSSKGSFRAFAGHRAVGRSEPSSLHGSEADVGDRRGLRDRLRDAGPRQALCAAAVRALRLRDRHRRGWQARRGVEEDLARRHEHHKQQRLLDTNTVGKFGPLDVGHGAVDAKLEEAEKMTEAVD